MADHSHNSTRRRITEGYSGAIVDDHHLYLNGTLGESAVDGPEDQLGAVTGGDDDRDLGA
jgi:hypothetical protein